MTIQIDNLTEAQEIAVKDMLANWINLGQAGASRWVAFYADGDGNFHPNITVDGSEPQFFGSKEEQRARWFKDEYRIDYDEIAWKLRNKHEDR